MSRTSADAATTAPETAPAVRAAHWDVLDAPIGPLLLAATEAGLVTVAFHAGPRTVERTVERLAGRLGGPVVRAGGDAPPSGDAPPAPPALAAASAELRAYFEGRLREFTVPLDWSLTGGFHERVLRELRASVPYGTTAGYQDLADRVGEPGAARAVGVAMGANPLPVVVPCHRVVESGGGLGGFGGGRQTKQALLALEGLLPEPLF